MSSISFLLHLVLFCTVIQHMDTHFFPIRSRKEFDACVVKSRAALLFRIDPYLISFLFHSITPDLVFPELSF